jgi:hypothetical protein
MFGAVDESGLGRNDIQHSVEIMRQELTLVVGYLKRIGGVAVAEKRRMTPEHPE